MEIDFSIPKYEKWIDWVKTQRQHNIDWETIKYARRQNEEGLIRFLNDKEFEDFYKHIELSEWYKLVEYCQNIEQEKIDFEISSKNSVIISYGEENDTLIPQSEGSSWVHYKKRLHEKGFHDHTIEQIEKQNYEILKKLSGDTRNIGPVKGMVVGNVQSGKTANMAALMAMAADNGWNLFIVLSGTIEALRKQTQCRLFDDLYYHGNISWEQLEHPSKKSNDGVKLQNLDLSGRHGKRYMTVCLKNKSRLKDLLLWLKQDEKNYSNLKILIIDDEADQAGVNTADIKTNERKAINKKIVEIVEGLDEKDQPLKEKCLAMNYVGYTATPYANVLNEKPGKNSLYPSSFIATLDVSNEYFGPQQVFGYEDPDEDESLNFPGMDIIREIPESEIEEVRDAMINTSLLMPKEMKKAICWFLCCVACMRLWKNNKPISMLIHTSQKTDAHRIVANSIEEWFEKTNSSEIIELCKQTYEYETSRMPVERFKAEYPNYGLSGNIKDYPLFDDLKNILSNILTFGITNIGLDDEQELCYNEGIHLCIDNCKNNGINEDGMHLRLAYPDHELDYTSAFIVIGGATLSRGLTIEGLVSTYFLRTVRQADTLMQMGRWFGYRKGYELLPRVWMSENTIMQFEFLSLLDQELRKEIYEMKVRKLSPSKYGPRVSQHPKVSFIRITNKKKMQSAQKVFINYCNSYNQTILFDDNKQVLQDNLNYTEEFIAKLGNSDEKSINNPLSKVNRVWLNVDYKIVEEYLKKYHFHSRGNSINDINNLCEWIEKSIKKGKLDNWNVIFAQPSNNKGKIWNTKSGGFKKISRSRKCIASNEEDDIYYKNKIINIGVLRSPRDLLSDVDIKYLNKDDAENLQINNLKDIKFSIARDKALPKVPQLIIYCIDRDTKARGTAINRKDLKAPTDIIGLCIGIPSGEEGVDYTDKVSINLQNNFIENTDISDEE